MIVKEDKKTGKITIDAFLARDKNGSLCAYISKRSPAKDKHQWFYDPTEKDDDFMYLPNDIRNDIAWDDEKPKKIKITIENV